MIEIKTEGSGKVLISNEILAVIAGKSAREVEGVAGLGGFGRNKKKGVGVQLTENGVRLAVAINVKMGVKLHEVSKAVQSLVKTDVETMTGLEVTEVNVRISAVIPERARG